MLQKIDNYFTTNHPAFAVGYKRLGNGLACKGTPSENLASWAFLISIIGVATILYNIECDPRRSNLCYRATNPVTTGITFATHMISSSYIFREQRAEKLRQRQERWGF